MNRSGRRFGTGRVLAALLSALVLVVSLAACGGGDAGQQQDPAAAASKFVGSWEIYEGSFDNGSFSNDEYRLMADAGMHATLDLDSDGNMLIDSFGDQYTGTWKMVDDDTVEFNIDGDTVQGPYADNKLTIEYEGEKLVYEKVSDDPVMQRDPQDNAGDIDSLLDEDEQDGDDLGSTDDDSQGQLDSDMAQLTSDLTEAQLDAYVSEISVDTPLDKVVVDDASISMTVVGIGTDYEGDTGYLLEVQNKTGDGVVVLTDTVTVDGEDYSDSGSTARYVPAGETKRLFMWFEEDDDADKPSLTQDTKLAVTMALIDTSYNLVGDGYYSWTL